MRIEELVQTALKTGKRFIKVFKSDWPKGSVLTIKFNHQGNIDKQAFAEIHGKSALLGIDPALFQSDDYTEVLNHGNDDEGTGNEAGN